MEVRRFKRLGFGVTRTNSRLFLSGSGQKLEEDFGEALRILGKVEAEKRKKPPPVAKDEPHGDRSALWGCGCGVGSGW